MQIGFSNKRQLQNNPSFSALKIANCKNMLKGVETSIDIYELNEKDKDYLDFLAKTTDLDKLAPNIREDMRLRWQKIFQYCMEQIKGEENNKNYLAFSNGKPCGVLTYQTDEFSSYLDGICKIPNPNEKLHLIGQSLMLKFLKSALQSGSKNISLDAVKDGPVDAIALYEKFGFKKVYRPDDDGIYQPMELNKYKLKEQIQKLEKMITYREEKNPEEVNLMNLQA